MIKLQLKELKTARGLTNKELSELSGVPIATINRVLAGQTEAPSFQVVCELVKAMGGSLDELAGISAKHMASGIPEESYRRVITEKNIWIKRLFIICCVLVGIIAATLIIDLLNPNIGYFLR